MELLLDLNALAPLAPIQDIVLLLVRIIFGTTFLYYGWPKLKDLKSNAEDFVQMGFKPGWFWGTIIALLETVGSVAVILGIFTWLMAIGFAIHMTLGTIWKITQANKPFTDWSYDLVLLSIALVLLTIGPGAITILFT